MKIERIRQNTIVTQVMNRIKNLIATGQYKPHDRIPTETELAKVFGIGRSSIREAIKIFQHLGILECKPRAGTYVCDASNISTEALTWSILLAKGDLFELIDLREVIEQKALLNLTKLSRQRREVAKGFVVKLQDHLKKMEEAVRTLRFENLIQSDYDFHGAIIESLANNMFASIYTTLRSFMLEEIKKTNLLETERRTLVTEHRAILNGIRSGDQQKALNAFNRHIESVRNQLKHSLDHSKP